MPITHAQFEIAGLKENERKLVSAIEELLKSHPHLAYNQAEIEGIIAEQGVPAGDRQLLGDALLFMTAVGILDSRIVRGAEYYAYLGQPI